MPRKFEGFEAQLGVWRRFCTKPLSLNLEALLHPTMGGGFQAVLWLLALRTWAESVTSGPN